MSLTFLIYFIFLIYLISFAAIDFFPLKTKQTVRAAFFPAALFLIFIGVFRYKNSGDWTTYEKIFKNINNTGNIFAGIEPGFGALCLFFGKHGTYRLMLFFMASISIPWKLHFIKKESDRVSLSVLIYFASIYIGSEFVNIRQAMALCFTMLAFNFAYKKYFFRFLTAVLAAFSFHYTAIIVFPFYFLTGCRLTGVRIIILLLICLVFSFYLYPLIGLMAKLLSIPYLNEKFLLYSWRDVKAVVIIKQIIAISLVKIPVIIFYCYYSNRLLYDKRQELFFKLYVWGYAIVLAVSQASATLVRFAQYFEIYEIILIPNMAKMFKKNEQFIFCILFIAYIIISLYRNCQGVTAEYPYQINFNLLGK
jgi:hypothetical protein